MVLLSGKADGSASTSRSARLSVSIAGWGVPAGAYMAFHDTTSNPGTVCAAGGISGSAGDGVGPLQASARSLPSVRDGRSAA